MTAGIRARFRAGEERRCLYHRCRVSLEGRKANARWCSVKCRTYWSRVEKRLDLIRRRPRCVICSNPLAIGKPGINHYVVTCSTKCTRIRRKWFGEPMGRIHDQAKRRARARAAAMARWHRAA